MHRLFITKRRFSVATTHENDSMDKDLCSKRQWPSPNLTSPKAQGHIVIMIGLTTADLKKQPAAAGQSLKDELSTGEPLPPGTNEALRLEQGNHGGAGGDPYQTDRLLATRRVQTRHLTS